MTNAYKVAVLEGDAIGPEIMRQAIRVFSVLEQHRDVAFELTHAPFGAQAYFDHGKAFPDDTKTICDNADAILKGPVGLSFEASKAIPVEEQAERGASCHFVRALKRSPISDRSTCQKIWPISPH